MQFLAGAAVALLLVGTVVVGRWVMEKKGREKEHEVLVGVVGATWMLIAFGVGTWLASWAIVGTLRGLAWLLGIRQ